MTVMDWSAAEAMPLPASSKTAFWSMSSWGVDMPETEARCDDVRVSVRVDPVMVDVPLRVTPPVDSPVSRRCRRSRCAVALSGSLKVMTISPLPVE